LLRRLFNFGLVFKLGSLVLLPGYLLKPTFRHIIKTTSRIGLLFPSGKILRKSSL